MFAYAPFMIAQAPYESTMGLVQKIFYFHVPSGIVMFARGVRLRRRERVYLFGKGRASRPAGGRGRGDSRCMFGLIASSPGRCGRARPGACGGSGTRG